MSKNIRVVVFLFLYGLLQLQHCNGQETSPQLPPIETLDREASDAGWLQLFDGKSLWGWKSSTKVDWKVLDGAIVATQGDPGILRTTSQFDDFQLCFEYRCQAETNSGVFLRTPPNPRNPANDCYEFNLAPASNPFPNGSLVAREKSTVELQPNDGNWRKVHIIADGGTITAAIDGERTIQYVDTTPLGRGYIGLQYNRGKIEFRNLFLRPLNLNPMLDKNLSNWKSDQVMESRFKVDENATLNVLGGRGQLESKKTYADFVFSMRCRTNAAGLNSGIFFRCIPGDLMNGYESQIQNEFLNNDRTKPKDCGTGGIFRRVNAKRIVANDLEWFAMTIIATGPHVSVWVNGQQVTDWSDTRKPDENPRRGKRLEAGSIILQGHDPTTDIDFKNLQVKELTVRWAKDR